MNVKKITLLLFFFTVFLNSQETSTSIISEYNRLLSKGQDSIIAFSNRLIHHKKNDIKAYGLAIKAYMHIEQSKFKLADDFFAKAFNLLQKNNPQETNDIKANILYLYALGKMERHQLEVTINTLNEAINNCSNDSSFMLKIRLQSTLARVYSLANNHMKALGISHISLPEIKNNLKFATHNEFKTEYAKELIKAASRSTNLYLSNKKKYHSYLDSTKMYTNACDTFSKQNSISSYNGYISFSNADINFYKKQYDSAKYYYKKGVVIFKKKKHKKKVEQALFKIAECEYFLKNYKLAKTIFIRQMNANIWDKFKLLENEANLYFYLFKINTKENKHNKALEYADSYSGKIKKHLKLKNATDLSVNNMILHEEKQKEIAGYIKNYEFQQKQNMIYLYFTISIIIIICVFFFFSKKRNKENINKLNSRIEQLQSNIEKHNTSNYKGSSLSDDNALKLLKRLKNLEKEALFQQQNYTLNMVAKRLKTNSSYLSKTVNQYLGLTFAEYTNSLKINAIVVKLKEQKNFRNYTINALAQEAGYKSANSFNSNFKKLLKVTPSQYLKELKRNN